MPSYRAFRQIKIRHIFIMQFGGYFVKFYSRQIFRPYAIQFFFSLKISYYAPVYSFCAAPTSLLPIFYCSFNYQARTQGGSRGRVRTNPLF